MQRVPLQVLFTLTVSTQKPKLEVGLQVPPVFAPTAQKGACVANQNLEIVRICVSVNGCLSQCIPGKAGDSPEFQSVIVPLPSNNWERF